MAPRGWYGLAARRDGSETAARRASPWETQSYLTCWSGGHWHVPVCGYRDARPYHPGRLGGIVPGIGLLQPWHMAPGGARWSCGPNPPDQATVVFLADRSRLWGGGCGPAPSIQHPFACRHCMRQVDSSGRTLHARIAWADKGIQAAMWPSNSLGFEPWANSPGFVPTLGRAVQHVGGMPG